MFFTFRYQSITIWQQIRLKCLLSYHPHSRPRFCFTFLALGEIALNCKHLGSGLADGLLSLSLSDTVFLCWSVKFHQCSVKLNKNIVIKTSYLALVLTLFSITFRILLFSFLSITY